MKFLFSLPILFYKKCISPLLPHVCRYRPSCSSYALKAIKSFGAVRGTVMGLYRILRCNPWAEGGVDLVPDNPKGKMRWLM